MTMGSRKTTPPKMLRMVPFGDFHIFCRPNSSTRASSGVMVAHFTPTPNSRIALAESTVTLSLVLSRYSIPRSKYFRSISRYGRMRRSLIHSQMMRVISSPSSSTTGFLTLIFAMSENTFHWGDLILNGAIAKSAICSTGYRNCRKLPETASKVVICTVIP